MRRALLALAATAFLLACGLKGGTPVPQGGGTVSSLTVEGREGAVMVSWEGDPDALAPRKVRGFDLLRREVDPDGESWFRRVGQVVSDGRHHYRLWDRPPHPGLLYVYRVRPRIEGEPTTKELRFAGPEASIFWVQPPAAPEEVAALPLHFAARISWDLVPGVSGYRVYEVDTAGTAWPEPANRGGLVETSSWTAVALDDGVPVRYVVRSVLLTGTSAQSTSSVRSGAAGGNQAPSGAELNASAGEGISVPVQALPGAAARAAANLLGIGPLPGIESGSSGAVTVTPGITVPPAAPHALRTASHDDGIHLSWSRSAGEEVVGYIVERATLGPDAKPSGPWQRLNPALEAGITYVDRDVKVGMSYEYRVRAQDAAGTVGDPSQSRKVTHRPKPEPPSP